MTRIVKEYIEAKIREGAQPMLDKINHDVDEIDKNTPTDNDVEKAVFGSAEYKALETFIRKWAKAHHATVRSTAYRASHLMSTEFVMDFDATINARKTLGAFEDKLNTAIRDALVAMELSKSKEDVDQLIAKAIEGLK